MSHLDELGRRHGTDKTTIHNYTSVYERYFAPLRDDRLTLLEIGVGGYADPQTGGQSLRMWAEYFPKATIIGLDDQPKTLNLPDRVRVYRGDQTDAALIERLVEDYGQLDIVIDDASHICELSIGAFKAVWPHLKPGGLYICEDVFTSYHAGYGGHPDPDHQGGDPTAMQFFRRMADDLNYRTGWGADAYPAAFWRGYRLRFAHFWPQLVILGKANDA
jgi:hypothetical protein